METDSDFAPRLPPPPADYARRMTRYNEAAGLEEVGPDAFGRAARLHPAAAQAWRTMQQAAAGDGVTLQLISAFRSVAYQAGIVQRKLSAGRTLDEILQVNAYPGYSEHHTGRAIDLSSPDNEPLIEAFETTAAFAWLQHHAPAHGFTLSYPRDNPHGIIYEPWHWCWHAPTP